MPYSVQAESQLECVGSSWYDITQIEKEIGRNTLGIISIFDPWI